MVLEFLILLVLIGIGPDGVVAASEDVAVTALVLYGLDLGKGEGEGGAVGVAVPFIADAGVSNFKDLGFDGTAVFGADDILRSCADAKACKQGDYKQ